MPRADKSAFTTSIPIDLLNRFRDYCRKSKLYQNEIVEKLLEDFLKEAANKEGVRHGTDN